MATAWRPANKKELADMGLRGRHAKARTAPASKPRRACPWKKKGLTRAQRVIAFCESLPITKGILAGQKMKLLPEQREFIETIYADTPRRIRIAISSLPRGNGKTGLAAALCLAHLLGPEAEARGECYSAAADKLQASILYKEMVAIIEAVDEFSDRVNVQRFHKILEVMEGDGAGSTYEALSADTKRPHGLAPSFAVVDEYAQAKSSDLVDGLLTGMGKRAEALCIIISTQAANDQHPLSEMIDDALRGEDPSLYCQLIAAPDEADTFDETTWIAANPGWGIFVNVDEFRAQAARAQRVPSFRAKFENLRLNRRIDAETQYLSDADWMACHADLDVDRLKGRPCFAGLDLSQAVDLTALVLYFPQDDGAVLPFFWLPAEGLAERDQKEGVHYRLWKDQGYLETTPGRAINFRAVIRRLAEITTEYDLRAVAYDRAYIRTFETQCAEEGVTLPLVEFGQGYVSMSPAVQLLEAAVLDKRIQHNGHPVLRWNVSNAAIEMDPAGNRKVTKKRSKGHVDGLVALLMAIGQSAKTPPKKASVYASRGLIAVGLGS